MNCRYFYNFLVILHLEEVFGFIYLALGENQDADSPDVELSEAQTIEFIVKFLNFLGIETPCVNNVEVLLMIGIFENPNSLISDISITVLYPINNSIQQRGRVIHAKLGLTRLIENDTFVVMVLLPSHELAQQFYETF